MYAQIVLGGIVRHSGAGLACGAGPLLCGHVVWPTMLLGRVQMLHRFGAVITVLAIVSIAAMVLRA